jgi:hypothetical protein
MSPESKPQSDFSAESQAGQSGIISEFVYFLSHTKKWWLTPIILVLLLMGIVIVIGGSAAAPFIYTLF